MARRPAGFTLMEVMLILFLVALLLGMVGVSLSSRVSAAETRAAAREIVAGLRHTRSQAILSKQQTVFTVDTEQKTWRAPDREAVTLPDDIDILLTTARSELTGESAGGIRFFPDGGSTGGRIDLVVRGREYSVVVNWLTGEARLETGTET